MDVNLDSPPAPMLFRVYRVLCDCFAAIACAYYSRAERLV
jgi:hypothetical protein